MILFADSFDARADRWTAYRDDGDSIAFVADGGRDGGACVRFQLEGGSPQQSVFVEKSLNHTADIFSFSGWWRFPTAFSFNPAPSFSGTEHKLLIVSTTDGVGRLLVNLRGGGTSPVLQAHLEKLDPYPPGVSQFSSTNWPPDGLWHRVEVELLRDSTFGRLRIWLDGRLAIDQSGRTCGDVRSAIHNVRVGAYSNQGSVTNQFFYVDDVVIGTDARSGGIVVPAPAPTPQPASSAFDPRAAVEILLQMNLDITERIDRASLALQKLLGK